MCADARNNKGVDTSFEFDDDANGIQMSFEFPIVHPASERRRGREQSDG